MDWGCNKHTVVTRVYEKRHNLFSEQFTIEKAKAKANVLVCELCDSHVSMNAKDHSSQLVSLQDILGEVI